MKKKTRRVYRVKNQAQPLTNTARSKEQKNVQFAAAYGAAPNKLFKPTFEHDVRDKPGLHRLYVEWAVRHLAIYEQAIRAFDRESNLNMIDGLCALIQERDKLIKTNAAYAEADKLIKIFKSVGPLPVQRDIEYNEEIDKDQS